MTQSAREQLEARVRGFPVPFVVIGIAIGMVLMVILFQHFEAAIKAWAGYSALAFPLVAVYIGIALVLWRKYLRDLARLLDDG